MLKLTPQAAGVNGLLVVGRVPGQGPGAARNTRLQIAARPKTRGHLQPPTYTSWRPQHGLHLFTHAGPTSNAGVWT